MMQKLDVWLFASLTGTLTLENGNLTFTYSQAWLQADNAVAVSCSLPLQPHSYSDSVARPFFAGLLPEGEMRRLLSKQYQISTHNDFALLNEIGGECAGAITFVEHGRQPQQQTADDSVVDWLDDTELASVLDKLPRRPMLAGDKDIRLSLAGAQSKLPVIAEQGRIGLPKNNAPSTHILKPAISDAPGSVVNEAFCLAVARKMNLDAAMASVHQVLDHQFLLVERYDRKYQQNAVVERVHQEDFCQALAVAPEMKYQNEGGPDFTQCFDLVRRQTRPNAIQVLKLLDAVFFNALIGNHDAHAKNFSLLYSARYPVLAPLYDLLCTTIYDDFTPKMAMKIGGKYRFKEVLHRHWALFAQHAGLTEALTLKKLQRFVVDLPVAAESVQQQYAEADSRSVEVTQLIVHAINQRCEITAKRLA